MRQSHTTNTELRRNMSAKAMGLHECTCVCVQRQSALHVCCSVCPQRVYQSQSQQSKCVHKGLPKHRRQLIKDGMHSYPALTHMSVHMKMSSLGYGYRKECLFSKTMANTLRDGNTKNRRQFKNNVFTQLLLM